MTQSCVVFSTIETPKLKHMSARFAAALSGRIDRAYFFGSLARDQARAGSDIDLIIVKQSDVAFARRSREFFDLYDIYPALDLLVYTEQEFEKLTKNPSPGFWRSVVGEMIRIV